jgi:hypothetical protein
MTWIKIDDTFPNHPKIVGLTDKAFRVHISGLCYCGTYLTDGYVPMTIAGRLALEDMSVIAELVNAGLWRDKVQENGFYIHDYLAHQTSKQQVEDKREALRERQKRYRTNKKSVSTADNYNDDWDNYDGNAVTNAEVTPTEYRIQNTEYINTEDINTEVTTSYGNKPPRVKSAKQAVLRISDKLANARANGINAWNLSRLVEDEWDILHNANDIGGCIALTAWYVSELQSRELTQTEIARIGQMTKRFGRIALLAIDEAASKDLTDLVSYAFRIAQNLYKEKAGK